MMFGCAMYSSRAETFTDYMDVLPGEAHRAAALCEESNLI